VRGEQKLIKRLNFNNLSLLQKLKVRPDVKTLVYITRLTG